MIQPREMVRLKIGSISVVLPVHENEEETLKIARRVEARLKKIEEESSTVDTMRFVLQAAYEFAAELHDLEKQYCDDEREFGKALEYIASELDEMEERFHLDEQPDEEKPLEAN